MRLADEWHQHNKGAIRRKALSERPVYIVSFGRSNDFPVILAKLVGARLVAFRSRYLSFLQKAKVRYDERVYRGINYHRLLKAHDIEPCDYTPPEPDTGADSIFFLPGGTGGGDGSLRGHKKWGVDRYYQVYMRLRERYPDYRYCFVLGPMEDTELRWLQKQATVPEILQGADASALFTEIARARLVIGNDCGPSHVAHALRRDMVQLFFEPNPEWFLPRPGAIELHGVEQDINTIRIETVEKAALNILDTPLNTSQDAQSWRADCISSHQASS